MSTLNDGTGIDTKPDAHAETDGHEQEGNGLAQAQPPAAGQQQGGLPGLAGFAQTDVFAAQSAAAPQPEPQPEPLPEEPQAPVMPEALAGAAVGQPAHVEADPVPMLPPEPEPVAPVEALQDFGETPFEPEPVQPEPQAPLEAPMDENWSLSGQSEAVPDMSLDGLQETAAGEPAAFAEEPQAPDDDFSEFSKDSLERFLAGEGTLPMEEEAQQPEIDQEAFPSQPDFDAGLAQDGPQLSDSDLSASTDLQAFEAHYDQPPEIAVDDFGQTDAEMQPAEPYFNEQTEADANFLDEEVAAGAAADASKDKGRKRLVMVASALVGSLALGGALAFAYKNSATIMGGSGEPPLIQADSKPVKQTPDDPGGKQFPHKNKLIYDRLQGDETPEVARIVPRQEEVAALANDAAATPQDTQAGVNAAAPTDANADGPKKVKTLVVKPDGTVVQPPQTQSASTMPSPPAQALALPSVPEMPSVPAPPAAQTAPPPPPVATPERKPAPAAQPTRTARAAPSQAAASSGSKYVVQVAARKSQTDALAAFADLQQKYPSLLNNYRPIIERADLGSKGVWYRLRVGPLNQKTSAANLCRKLKSAGMSSCLVRSYSGS